MATRMVEPRIRVLICCKYTLFREGIKALLSPGGQIEVAGEASCAVQAIGMLDEIRPSVVLMDLVLPDLSGWEATRRIKVIAPGVEVLIVPLSDDPSMLRLCLQAGAFGHVRTNDMPRKLTSAIQSAYMRGAHAA